MIVLLGLGLAGLASLPLWPAPWRLGLGLGWAAAAVAEAGLLLWRHRVLAGPAVLASFQRLLLAQVTGFLGKLLLLVVGGVLGARTGWYHFPSFLLAFAAGLVAAGAAAQAVLARSSRHRPASRPAAGAPPSP